MSASPSFGIPPFLLTDAYKLTHYLMYPDVCEMAVYSEFRQSFGNDGGDERVVFYGLRYIIEQYIAKKWTLDDIDKAESFLCSANSGHTMFPFPRDLFVKMVTDNDGFFPVRISALPEGSVVYPHVPTFIIEAFGDYAPLATYLETLLSEVWYPSTVATLSRRTRDLIEKAFEISVDDDRRHLVQTKLGDFGMRGCTSIEQCIVGGTAHLLSFDTSSTLPAAYYAQYSLNNGVPLAVSVPSTEHSVIMSWQSEHAAIDHVLDRFGHSIVSILLDSYDYMNALKNLLPAIKTKKLAMGGILMIRPDSGDPVATVLAALGAAEKVFGTSINSKGYKVLERCGVIQGDGLSYAMVSKILNEVQAAGYSAENVNFGMGSGLLQRVHRDSMQQATKLSFVKLSDGTERDVMKVPKSDMKKASLPGRLWVCRNSQGRPMVYPAESREGQQMPSIMEIVYDGCDKIKRHFDWESFAEVRTRLDRDWRAMPMHHNPISLELKAKIMQCASALHSNCPEPIELSSRSV